MYRRRIKTTPRGLTLLPGIWNAVREQIPLRACYPISEKTIMKFLERTIMAAMLVVMIFVLWATVNNVRAEVSQWKPDRYIEFVIPVGCCSGGANDMVRFIKMVVEKHNLADQNILAMNKPTGPGSEGYVYLKKQSGDNHKIGLAITSIFSHSIANPQWGFHYSQLTPIVMLALDDFILWVPKDSPFQTANDFLGHVKTNPNRISLGGLNVKQEDQIVTVAMERARSVKFVYVPYKSGGEIAQQLAGGHIDSSVNNPSEGVQFWKSGKIKPLCVFSNQRMPYREKIVDNMSWNDIPTCREQGIDVTYKMMRSVFGPPDMSPQAVDFYVDLLRKVTQTEDWQKMLTQNALDPQFMTGNAFKKWLEQAYRQHENIMQSNGMITQ